MTDEQQDVSSATAGGAPAPDQLGKAVAEAFTEALSGVAEAWKQIIAANPGLAYLAEPVAAEILPADRKAVYSEPGIDTDWDEDTDAMVVHGVGWSLSWGCRLSIARDHDTGEHYVCVNTSGEDQRKGIVSRSTTREQIAAFGQLLLNVFGEPDPRDAEIKRLRGDLGESQNDVRRCSKEIERLSTLLNGARSERDTARAALDRHLADENSAQAANDRLRAELDFAAAQCRQTETERDALAVALVHIQQTLTAVDRRLDIAPPAEPRRWSIVASEPPVGTTVRRADDDQSLTWTKRLDGTWHANSCSYQPEDCDSTGTTWSHVLLASGNGELVEVPADNTDEKVPS